MNKILLKDFRPTKEFTLPISKVTLVCYPSLMVSEMSDLKEDVNSVDTQITMIIKIIKEWNLYENDADEKALPITLENFKKIPAVDFQWFSEQIALWVTEQKKSSTI